MLDFEKMTMNESSGVPAGIYTGEFSGYELVPSNEEKGFGEGIKWIFKVVTGDHAGATTCRITGTKPTTKNACGKMLSGLNNKPLADGESVNVKACVGQRYTLVVQPTQSGGTRVDTIMPVQA